MTGHHAVNPLHMQAARNAEIEIEIELELGAYPQAVALAEEIKKTQRMEIMSTNMIIRAKSGATA